MHPSHEQRICTKTKRLEVEKHIEKLVSGTEGKSANPRSTEHKQAEAPLRQAVVLLQLWLRT